MATKISGSTVLVTQLFGNIWQKNDLKNQIIGLWITKKIWSNL